MTPPSPASSEPRPADRVRLEDVAAAAGVSRTSVSRVMLGQGKVSEQTRRRVLAIADELGYVTNVAASELASGGSSTVGLLLRDASNPAYGLLFSELQAAAHAAGITLLTMTIKHDDRGRVWPAPSADGHGVAGLIVATGGISDQLEPFRDRIPIIRAGRPRAADASTLSRTTRRMRPDDWQTLDLGHTEVAVQAARAEDSYPEYVRSTVMCQVLEGRGATVHRLEYRPGHDAMDESVDLVRRGRVSAVMVPSDLRQLTLIRRLQEAGMRTPEDVATTGCDGILPGIDLLGLSTMRIAVEDVAERTIAHIARMIGGDGAQEVPRPDDPAGGRVVHERLPGRFIQGRTAGPPRTTGRPSA